MKNTEFLNSRSMTPEDVLSVFRDEYRHAERHDPEVEPGFDLTFGTTIAEWQSTCDLVSTQKLCRALNEGFGIEIAEPEWLAVLQPEGKKAVRGVCELIAGHAKAPIAQPFLVFGKECDSAGAFLTIRTLLSRGGIDGGSILPSTTLDEFARRDRGNYSVLGNVMARLAPGALPVAHIEEAYPRLNRCTAGISLASLFICVAMMALDFVFASVRPYAAYVMWAGLSLLAAAFLVSLWSEKRPWRSVSFGNIRTFRDLSHAVVAHTIR